MVKRSAAMLNSTSGVRGMSKTRGWRQGDKTWPTSGHGTREAGSLHEEICYASGFGSGASFHSALLPKHINTGDSREEPLPASPQAGRRKKPLSRASRGLSPEVERQNKECG